MANPLFGRFGPGQTGPANPMSNMMNMMQQFNQFKSQFKGDPRQQVQQLLASGQMSQDQFNQLSEMAKQFQSMFGAK